VTEATKTITIKQVIKMADKPPEGSWQTKVPLGCAISMEYSQQSQGQELASSSLANCFKL